MTRPEQNTPDNTPDPMRDLLRDAVTDVEPSEALSAIRARTARPAPAARRRWGLVVAGAAVATAAVVGAVVVATGTFTDRDTDDPGPAASQSISGTTQDEVAAPVYFVGETPRGPRLFREFHPVVLGQDTLLTASVREAVQGDPFDPDYASPWPDGTTLRAASYDAGVITVDLSSEGDSLRDRPGDLTPAQARMALEQVIFTAQGAVKDGRKPVRLLVDGAQTDQVLGEPAGEELSNGKVLSTLSLVNVTAPREGVEVSDSFTATGVANSFEGNVPWQLLRDGKVVREGFATTEGTYGNQLWPWQTEVDLAGLEPGRYVFVASTDDPSGGAEGSGPDQDSRTVIVR